MTVDERRRRLKVARLRQLQTIALRHAARQGAPRAVPAPTDRAVQTTLATTGAGTTTTGQRS
jgi:hypothetical protein